MKKIFIYIMAAGILSGCDVVDAPYSVSTPVNSNVNDSAVMRKVLLEDYTGHKCQVCPGAHVEARTLKDFFKDSLIVMTIHAGYYSTHTTAPFTYDFTTPEGLAYYNEFIPSSQPFPFGTINRKTYGSQQFVDYPYWSGKIDTLLNEPPAAKIKITPAWDPGTRMISVYCQTTFLENITGAMVLSVLYTEDSIVNWQAFPTPVGNVSNYVHRHVLRGSLNGIWGNNIALNPGKGNIIITNLTGSAVATDVVAGHVSVIAILYDDSTKEILQAEEVKLLQ